MNALNEIQKYKRKSVTFFRELEKDRSITEVGVAESPKAPLAVVVPNTEFAERSGLWAVLEEEGERITYPVVDVVLIGPILLPQERAWRFRSDLGEEFSATMRDEKFLKALEHASVHESLRVGIPMTLRLKLEEKKVDGAWTLKKGGRSVVEVLSPRID
ncbi:hypothetical protein ACO2I3_02505 [Leptospira interrogans]